MSIDQADLIERLKEDVPARSSIPTDNQYQRCVTEAVADLARRSGRKKIYQMTLESGTDAYDLPADFVSVITFSWPSVITTSGGQGVIFGADSKMIPVSGRRFTFDYTVEAGQVTFYPTPQSALIVDLHYKAGFALSSGAYAAMTEEDAEILLLLAASKALTMQSNKAAQEAWTYQVGDERVSKEKLAAELSARSKEARDQYMASIKAKNGAFGVRSEIYRGDIF
jgi:hypothetical protein